jgi:hypothetical protein
MRPHLLQSIWATLIDQINPINQNRILRGRNTTKKTRFRTAVTPTKTDATRKNIPMNIIMGTWKTLNISLYITSDTEFIGISVLANTDNRYIWHFMC